MTDVKTDVVLYEVRDRIATLTLNRPDRLNAWTGGLARRYYSLLEDAAADPDVRAIVVTAAGAKFTTAFVRRGLVAEHGSSWVLPRLIGHARARDLLYSGRVFLAEEAKELGVVNQVFAPEELVDRTREYAQDLIRHCSPRSMATIKAEIYRHWNMELAPAVKEANELMVRSLGFPDFKEGVQSFVQRRDSDFASLPADYEVLPKEWI